MHIILYLTQPYNILYICFPQDPQVLWIVYEIFHKKANLVFCETNLILWNNEFRLWEVTITCKFCGKFLGRILRSVGKIFSSRIVLDCILYNLFEDKCAVRIRMKDMGQRYQIWDTREEKGNVKYYMWDIYMRVLQQQGQKIFSKIANAVYRI